jgi:hypothetical protein
MTLRSVVGRSFAFFAISVPFLIGILHTEIAKITKADLDWMTLRSVVIPSFAFFAISV